ncbi:unnamed protein product [Alopecurus aequalis]
MSKKLLFLAILLIASLETMVRGELVCNKPTVKCMLKCYTGSGKCMRCCQAHGYVDGICNTLFGNLCYCCLNVDDPPFVAAANQTGVPTLTRHFL